MAYNTIKLKKYLDIIEEITATAVAITPGMLLELTSSCTVQAHSTAGGNVLHMFALEDELQGGGIDDNYAVSAKIQVWVPVRGEIVYGILVDGENVSCGDFLESNGAGFLQKHDPDEYDTDDSIGGIFTNQIVGQAIDSVDLSGSSGEESSGGEGFDSSVGTLGYNKRIKVRIK